MKSFEEAVKLLIKDKDFLVQGGNIDIKNMTLDPTIITKDYLDLETNYEEYYAPIFRILLYESELDLKKYFSNKKYKEETERISGTSPECGSAEKSSVTYSICGCILCGK